MTVRRGGSGVWDPALETGVPTFSGRSPAHPKSGAPGSLQNRR
jgi:hypothetical protein